MTGAMTFAFGAGLLATVSPCAFVMLPSFLAMSLGAAEERDDDALLSRCAHGLAMGLAVSATFSAVLVFAGLVLAAGMRALVNAIPWLAVAVGVGLVIAGVAMLIGRELALAAVRRLGPRAATGPGYAQAATFGVGYAVASLSCSIAVVLAVATQATATANPIQVLAVFGAFAAGATSALLALSLSVALAKGFIARAMRRVAPAVNPLAGVLLILSGAYLIAYWLPALLGHDADGSRPLEAATRTLSSSVANFLAAHTGAFAIGLAITAATSIGLAAAMCSPTAPRGRTQRPRTPAWRSPTTRESPRLDVNASHSETQEPMQSR
jgi:cytochrome c-type biogenesis protein